MIFQLGDFVKSDITIGGLGVAFLIFFTLWITWFHLTMVFARRVRSAKKKTKKKKKNKTCNTHTIVYAYSPNKQVYCPRTVVWSIFLCHGWHCWNRRAFCVSHWFCFLCVDAWSWLFHNPLLQRRGSGHIWCIEDFWSCYASRNSICVSKEYCYFKK